MSTTKQPRRRVQVGILVATTNQSLFNCIKSGKNKVIYRYNELNHNIVNRQFITSY